MHITITFNGVSYELQISARKLENGGVRAFSMDDNETALLFANFRQSVRREALLPLCEIAAKRKVAEAFGPLSALEDLLDGGVFGAAAEEI